MFLIFRTNKLLCLISQSSESTSGFLILRFHVFGFFQFSINAFTRAPSLLCMPSLNSFDDHLFSLVFTNFPRCFPPSSISLLCLSSQHHSAADFFLLFVLPFSLGPPPACLTFTPPWVKEEKKNRNTVTGRRKVMSRPLGPRLTHAYTCSCILLGLVSTTARLKFRVKSTSQEQRLPHWDSEHLKQLDQLRSNSSPFNKHVSVTGRHPSCN